MGIVIGTQVARPGLSDGVANLPHLVEPADDLAAVEERSRLRNGQAIANQNSLIYVLINLRALQRVRRKKAERNSSA